MIFRDITIKRLVFNALVLPLAGLAVPAIAGINDVGQSLSFIEKAHSASPQAPIKVVIRLEATVASVQTLGHPTALQAQIDSFAAAAKAAGISNVRTLDARTGYIALSANLVAIRALASRPDVAELFEDVSVEASQAADANYAAEVGLTSLSVDGAGTMVTIVDSGVDASHPFFSGRVVEEACFLSSGGCPKPSGPGAAAPIAGGEHGTHVAGIAAGKNSTLRGASPSALIGAVRVFDSTQGSTSDIIAGLGRVGEFADRYYVTASNMSLGISNKSTSAQFCSSQNGGAVVQALRAKGIAVAVASGNNYDHTLDGVRWPACLPGVIAVGSSDGVSAISDFTNLGQRLDILAPGRNLLSSVPGGGYMQMTGTSMATPVIAGGISTLRSEMDWPVDSILAALKANPAKLRGADNNLYTVANFQDAYNRLIAATPTRGDVYIKDNASDVGRTDSAHAGGGLTASPDIWVRNNALEANPPHVHQNPEFGQPNSIFTYLRNTGGGAQAGKVVVFRTLAIPRIDEPANWIKVGEQSATVPPYGAAVAKIIWNSLPAPGHYCLLAFWVPSGKSDALQLPGGIYAAVAANPHLAWHNVDIVDASSGASFLANLRIYSPQGENIAFDVRPGDAEGSYALIVRFPPGTRYTPDPTWTVTKTEAEGSEIRIPLGNGVTYIGGVRPADPNQTMVPLRFRIEQRGEHRHDGASVATVRFLQLDSIERHKANGSTETGSITYLLFDNLPARTTKRHHRRRHS